MNGPAKIYYNNLDGSADWLKTIVRTVHVYTEDRGVVVTDLPTMTEIDHRETIVFVESVAAKRAQNLYFRKIGSDVAQNLYFRKIGSDVAMNAFSW